MSRVMIVDLRTRGHLGALFQTEGFEVETVGSFDRIEAMMAAFDLNTKDVARVSGN